MAIYHGKNVRAFINGEQISALVAAIGMKSSVDLAQYAVCDGNGYQHIRGLSNDGLVINGIFDDNYLTQLHALRTASGAYVVSVPLGTAQGDRALCAPAVIVKNVQYPAKSTEILKATFDLVLHNGRWEECVYQTIHAARTADGNGTTIDQLGSSSAGGVGYLQVTAIGSNDILTVTIQDSANDADWADLITFAAVEGSIVTSAAERATVAGAVDRYVRAIWVFSGGGGPPYTATFSVYWKRS